MNIFQRFLSPDDDKQSPGSGGGVAGDPGPGELEHQAAQKSAGQPGDADNVAGFGGDLGHPSGIGSKPADDAKIDRGDHSGGTETSDGSHSH